MWDVGTLERLLAERIGLDPSTVGDGLLARALNARMSALGLGREEDYVQLLLHSTEEQEALVEEVVVPESWFFRDGLPFERFRDHVRALWMMQPDRPPLRVLSIPCAGGEEPYSVAIALLDLGLPSPRWAVDAVDISARALERAARGVYRGNAFRGADLAFRDRYFREALEGKGHELDAVVRAFVRFRRGNLLDPSVLQGEPHYDVIFCRNLLIYLDPTSRRRVLGTLDRLLGPDGLLFLGHADRLEEGEARFEASGNRGAFAYRRTTAGAKPTAPTEVRNALARPGGRGKAQRAPIPQAEGTGARSALPRPHKSGGSAGKHHADSLAVSPGSSGKTTSPPTVPAPKPAFPDTPALLDEAAALADQGRNSEAAALCERSLREAGPNARAFFLLGMIRRTEGDVGQAEACLQKTVYLDPQHDDALLALALLAERRGDEAAASGYRRRAARAHRKKGPS